MPLGRPPNPDKLPDGQSSRVRSVALEPHLDALVHAHQRNLGFDSLSAALRDLVDRGLAATGALSGAGADAKARAYREASLSVKREALGVIETALGQWLERRGASRPKVKVEAEDAHERARPRRGGR